jgi:hypothetical protein
MSKQENLLSSFYKSSTVKTILSSSSNAVAVVEVFSAFFSACFFQAALTA